ncbi:MAG: thioredoxin domain-containing protein [Candidatus Bipolaricaulota bacterium]|nr:thioredoxin domain-containing protein [Candidatus Bipolaricaulota bacterium]MCS7274429.1 thioredoxin domain-containing protein [Candidatus Bipolaricaulota bacterium]MDW8110858.1 thioredoxin domain-containing protein [Candidatus Bipolaricaulota bacterium]MDW8328661.1 thioredoxin domain-containing protein [Candidatus Bipolaricaulota bacterium]
MKPNRLIHETSPYLQQHAYNPVDWYPWGAEALERARREDKPILLSIGYSACHWCHVMEHESFENEEIARFMNEHFVNIKVDREERPDLDEIYMTAVQLMTGQGGWPLTVFLTPDLKPFYGGTYFPPEDRWGRPGFLTVLKAIVELYGKERARIVEHAAALTQHLQQLQQRSANSETNLLTPHLLQRAYLVSLESFDRVHGGFGGAPKFPHSMELSLLLRYFRRTGDRDALQIVEFSLERMARGGIYDQLGGGFHRYSVDAQWRVPHFEKMLYDNALLVWSYLEAYQATKKSLYRRIVEETLEYVRREMTSPDGGFYSSQDADSADGEGAFFVWRPEEIKRVLGERDGALACEYFGVTETGNFEHHTSVLHVPYMTEEFLAKAQMTESEFLLWLARVKRALFAERERRAKPARDEKILTAWNGLMISAFARAYQVLGTEEYLRAATNAARFCLEHLKQNEKLLRTYKDGQAKLNGYLEDYAFLITALLDLYEANFDLVYLKEALALSETMRQLFWDEASGGFFFTAHDHERLLVRPKSFYDGATPSGASAAVLALLRLAEFTGRADLRALAEQALRSHQIYLERSPQSFAHWLCALDFYLGPIDQIALVGEREDQRTIELLRVVRERFLPNKIVAVASDDQLLEWDALSPLFRGKRSREGRPTVFLCRGYACQAPLTEPEALETALSA